MNKFSFFSHHRLSDHIYIIRESFGFDKNLPNSYFFLGVVIGKDKVAIFDAGNGATNGLREYIETNIPETREKPMVCFLSHNHLDHIGACMMFDERYMHKDDINEDEIEWATNLDRHFLSPDSDMAAFCQHNLDVMEFVAENYYKVLPTANDFIPVEDGDLFDIGGITIEAIHTPGHSRGSCCYYLREDHFIFAGDAITPNGMIPSPVKVGDESETIWYLKRVKEKCAPDSLILDGHNFLNGMLLIDKLIEGFKEVFEGRNLQNDFIAPPGQFIYKDEKHSHPRVPGVIQMRHIYKDINVNYRVKTQV